ncbi:MAG: methyltransferase [Pseudomonadota bacterium]
MIFNLALGLGASLLWIALLIYSKRQPDRRIWPPLRYFWLTAIWAWGLTIAIYVGQIGAGTTEWNAWGWPGWLRHGLGGGLSLLGSAYQSWAVLVLGLKGTSGWPVPLVTNGPYAQMRHPQYLGQMATFLGIAIWCASPAAFVIGLAGAAALVLAARVENRFLAETQTDHHSWAARVPGVLS